MMVFGVTLDWAIVEVALGSPEMMACQNVRFSKKDAEEWIKRNAPTRAAK